MMIPARELRVGDKILDVIWQIEVASIEKAPDTFISGQDGTKRAMMVTFKGHPNPVLLYPSRMVQLLSAYD